MDRLAGGRMIDVAVDRRLLGPAEGIVDPELPGAVEALRFGQVVLEPWVVSEGR